MVEYAAALARSHSADTVKLNAYGADGDNVETTLLLDEGAPLMIETSQSDLPAPDIVISAKLRRGEKFFFSWQDNISVGSGRSSIWLEQSIPLYFKFAGSRPVEINKAWLAILVAAANSTSGLTFLPEPGSPTGTTPLPRSRV